VRENASFSLSEISGELFNRKYGQAESWWRGRVGVTKLNFRGANEALTIRVTFWDSRSIGFLWQKPFIATPYYMAFGAGLGTGPSTVDTTDNNFIYQSINFGRRFTKSTIYTRETTLYNRHTWKGSRDTSLQTQEKIRIKEKPYSEVFYTIGWNREGRDATFNAHRGIFSGVSATTTVIPADENNRYIELNSEIKFYHPGIFPRHTAAYYLHPSIRFGTGYIFEGKYIGGIGSLRAYSSDAFGSGVPFIYNNRVVFTYEYRFFLFRMPEMRFPWLAWYHRSLKNFNFHVDGAIFLDCGYLWKDWYNPLASGKESRAASGAGLGLRVMAPSMKRSVNLDFAWMVFPDPREYYKKPWLPFINLYLDLPF
jgi:outer membrane protein assembly factor BamA